MIPNNVDSGLTNIMGDEKLRNDYLGDRYSRLEKGLLKLQKPGILKKLMNWFGKKKKQVPILSKNVFVLLMEVVCKLMLRKCKVHGVVSKQTLK